VEDAHPCSPKNEEEHSPKIGAFDRVRGRAMSRRVLVPPYCESSWVVCWHYRSDH
jgi:hypothetical protein